MTDVSIETDGKDTNYDLEELALYFVFLSFGLHLSCYPEHLIYRTWDHTCRRLSLPQYTCLMKKKIHMEPPSVVNELPDPVCPYAKIQTLYPSVQLCASWEISSNTSARVASGSKTVDLIENKLNIKHHKKPRLTRSNPKLYTSFLSCPMAFEDDDGMMISLWSHASRYYDIGLNSFCVFRSPGS